MNVAIITTNIGFGGAEKQVCFLANGLVARGHEVAIINMNVFGSYLQAHTQPYDERVKIHTLSTYLPSPLTNIEWVSQTTRILRRLHTEIVIGFTFTPSYVAQICGKIAHIPSIISERVDPNYSIPDTWSYRLRLKWINRADGGVFQTEGAKAYYAMELQRRSIVIPNPITKPDSIAPVRYDASQKHVVSIGRFDDNQQKRYDILLQTFAKFHTLHSDYSLLLYGSGPMEQQIRTWVKELKLETAVQFMGVTKSAMQTMSEKGGIFIITSDYEGISNALLEAMAVGMPVVSTDHSPGGARLLIDDHKNGLLAPTGNTEQLCQALCEYAENPKLATLCGQNAQEVLERFAPKKLLDHWNEYILSVKTNAK